jgi:hypothetical protein
MRRDQFLTPTLKPPTICTTPHFSLSTTDSQSVHSGPASSLSLCQNCSTKMAIGTPLHPCDPALKWNNRCSMTTLAVMLHPSFHLRLLTPTVFFRTSMISLLMPSLEASTWTSKVSLPNLSCGTDQVQPHIGYHYQCPGKPGPSQINHFHYF